MNKEAVRSLIDRIGIVPCARVTNPAFARFAAETLCAVEIPLLEIPLALAEAPQIIEELAVRFPDMAVGAGTVQDEDSARRCVDAGARFITSPGFVPEVVACAVKAGAVVFPGVLTPTEAIAAWKAGADFVKIFPTATIGGSHYLRALKVPLPQIPLIVAGGVNQMTAFDFILAGASAIGIGRELLPREALERRQETRINELAHRFLQLVCEAREQREEF